MSARGADTQVRPYAKAGIQPSIEVESECRLRAHGHEASDGEFFGHPVKRTQVRSVGQYRGWRLCLRSEAPKLFLPISALLLKRAVRPIT